jgi:thiol-disulfide isomerase/thioredoxin
VKRLTLLILVFWPLLLYGAEPAARPYTAPPTTFEAACKQSIAEGRPLLVLLSAAWCPGCQWVKQNCTTVMQGKGVVIVVDVDQRPDLYAKYGQQGPIPRLLVCPQKNGRWEEPTVLVGPGPIQSYLERLSSFKAGVAAGPKER